MILSADDFGISPAVDEAIIRLVEKKRISSTGCMVAGTNPHLFRNLSSLKNLCADIDVGLHLVLTDITPLAEYSIKEGFVEKNGRLPSLKTLALKSYLRLLTQETIEKEILAQISEFERIFGCAPDFVDGHQHVSEKAIRRHEHHRNPCGARGIANRHHGSGPTGDDADRTARREAEEAVRPRRRRLDDRDRR